MQVVRPRDPRGRLASRIVVAETVEFDRLELSPAARSQVFVGLGEQPVKVLHHSFHLSSVDEVEWLRVGPIAFVVIDLELEIGRDPAMSWVIILAGVPFQIGCAKAYHDGWIGLKSFPDSDRLAL